MGTALFFVFASFVLCSGPVIGRSIHLQKRAAFYIANETACVVDNTVYYNGDPIPTDDPCEACKCRPPGFACVLRECEIKPGCRAVRRAGHCCPEYICGCEHNGRMYRDGDEIRDSQNPCYTCHCQGSAIACAFVDCFFRVDCAPDYVPGECCPRYDHCAPLGVNETFVYTQSTSSAEQPSTYSTRQGFSTELPATESGGKDVTFSSSTTSTELLTEEVKSDVENEIVEAEGKQLGDLPKNTEDKEEELKELDSEGTLVSTTQKAESVDVTGAQNREKPPEEILLSSIEEQTPDVDFTTAKIQTVSEDIKTEIIPTITIKEENGLQADTQSEAEKTKAVSDEISEHDITTTDYSKTQSTSKKELTDIHFKFDTDLVHTEETISTTEKSDSKSTETEAAQSKAEIKDDHGNKEILESSTKQSEPITEQDVFFKNNDEIEENSAVEEDETKPIHISTQNSEESEDITKSTESPTLIPLPVLFLDAQKANTKLPENGSGVTIFNEEKEKESDQETTEKFSTDEIEKSLLQESTKLAEDADSKTNALDTTTTSKTEVDADTAKEVTQPEDVGLLLKSLGEATSSEEPQNQPNKTPVEESTLDVDEFTEKDTTIGAQDQSLSVSPTADDQQTEKTKNYIKKDKSLDGKLQLSSEVLTTETTLIKGTEYSKTEIDLPSVTEKIEEQPVESFSSEVLSDSLEETDRGKIDEAKLTTLLSQEIDEHKDTSNKDGAVIDQLVDKKTTYAEIEVTTLQFE